MLSVSFFKSVQFGHLYRKLYNRNLRNSTRKAALNPLVSRWKCCLRPTASGSISRPRSQLFTIRTSQPANNLYLFRYRSTFSLLNSCTQLTKCQFCHANTMLDSEFYRQKIIMKLRTLLRKLIEIR